MSPSIGEAVFDPRACSGNLKCCRSDVVQTVAGYPGHKHADDRHTSTSLGHTEVACVDEVAARDVD